MSRPIRATFLTTMPSPYMRDIFKAMRDDGRIVPRVLYMEMSLPQTHWGTAHLEGYEQVLPGRGIHLFGARLQWNPRIRAALDLSDSDVFVIGGYSSPTCQMAARYLRKKRHPWVFFGERPGIQSRRLAGRAMRATAMATMLRSANAIAAVGSAAVHAYRARCVAGQRIANIPYFTDTRPFRNAPAYPGQRGGSMRILYCGQLIERKGVDVLVRAFCRVARECSHLVMDLVGEGPLRERLRELIPDALKDRVIFHGFSPVEELPRYFARADLFVLPSRHDGWGVVINQALAAGLPVIASNAVGAAQDFVANRNTGLIVPPDNETALANALARLTMNPCELKVAAERARDVAEELTLERGVDQWVALLEATLAEASRRDDSTGKTFERR